MRGGAGAEQPVEQGRRVVPQEHHPIDVGELGVEEVVGPKQWHHGLEVPVREIARVEGDDGDRHDAGAPGRPALPPYGRHGRARGPAKAREAAGAEEDVDADEQGHPGPDLEHVKGRDVVGVAEGHAGGAGRDQGGDGGDGGDDGPGGHRTPARLMRLALGVPPRDAPSPHQLDCWLWSRHAGQPRGLGFRWRRTTGGWARRPIASGDAAFRGRGPTSSPASSWYRWYWASCSSP